MSFIDIKKLTNKFRVLEGGRDNPPPKEVIDLQEKIRLLNTEVAKLKSQGAQPAQYASKMGEIGILEGRLRKAFKTWQESR